SFTTSWAQFSTTNYNRAIRFFIQRVTPGNFGPTFTHGATGTGAGELQNAVNARRWTSSTYAPALVWRYQGPLVKGEGGAGYSPSASCSRDIDDGDLGDEILWRRQRV